MTETVTEATAPRRLPGWIRRRKALVIGLAVTMLAAVGLAGFIATRPGPEDVVGDYLDVLRAKDADAALEYASEVTDLDTVTSALLVDDAMSGDWEITELVTRHEDDRFATIDVTITAADETARQARFELDADGPDGWRILNPLVKLDLSNLPMRFAEFNGVVAEAEALGASAVSADPETRPSVFAWLFPGAYTPFGDSADQLELSLGTYVAVPTFSTGVETPPQVFLPEITPLDALTAEANAQLADWIDECAKSTDITPKGCPFAGGSGGQLGLVTMEDGEDFLPDEVTWKVETYPVIRLLQERGRFTVREVEPGEMTISGTVPDVRGGGGSERDFSGDCDTRLGEVTGALTGPGTFTFTAADPEGSDDYHYTCVFRYS